MTHCKQATLAILDRRRAQGLERGHMGDVARASRRWCAVGRAVLVLVLACTASAGAAGTADVDTDTIADDVDNCIAVANTNQLDADGDRVGDACDMCLQTRSDVPDGIGNLRLAVDQLGCSLAQLCPCRGPMTGRAPWRRRSSYIRCLYRETNRLDRLRIVSRRERAAIILQGKSSKCGLFKGVAGDRDGDGILEDGNRDGVASNKPCASRVTADCDDNCPGRRNRDQVDQDKDGKGNRCDLDKDGDGIKNRKDNCPLHANVGQEDGDEDDVGDACDDCKDSDENASVGRNGCD
jgi:hypothetical protein